MVLAGSVRCRKSVLKMWTSCAFLSCGWGITVLLDLASLASD
jgi:hypothetical protein